MPTLLCAYSHTVSTPEGHWLDVIVLENLRWAIQSGEPFHPIISNFKAARQCSALARLVDSCRVEIHYLDDAANQENGVTPGVLTIEWATPNDVCEGLPTSIRWVEQDGTEIFPTFTLLQR